MFHFKLIAYLSFISLMACGDKDGFILPQSGDWTIVTTGYTNDDCNAAGFLIPPDSITFADVDTSSFSITYYIENERIEDSRSTCSHTGDNIFECEDLIHSTPFSANATVSMVSTSAIITMTSETSASGVGNLTLECTGSDCGQLSELTNTGSLPCDTTINWTAAAEE